MSSSAKGDGSRDGSKKEKKRKSQSPRKKEKSAGDADGAAGSAGGSAGSTKPEPAKTKKKLSFEGYWNDMQGEGSIFLRKAMGGEGYDSTDAWEFQDVVDAIVAAKIKGIQGLHDKLAPAIQEGKPQTDLADLIGIPGRVFVIPMLIKAFDDKLAAGEINAYAMEAADGTKQHSNHRLEEFADYNEKDEEDEEAKDETKDIHYPPVQAVGYNDLLKQAGVAKSGVSPKKKSSACNIL